MSATSDLLRSMHRNEAAALARVGDALPEIGRAADALADRLASGGRWVYAGAGTSGRLAALDAAELPPTFGTDPWLVSAVIAGGPRAMREAIEGAEDDEDAARRDLAAQGLGTADALVAVSASGTTPYTLAALRAAREAGALCVGVACVSGAPLLSLSDHPILVETGPEAIAGSTRLSAGTAQKVVLNMLSTAAMSALGLVVGGEMAALRATNAKLRARAVGIVARLSRRTDTEASELLEAAGWHVSVALVAATLGMAIPEARDRLRRAGGNVARALAVER